MQRPGPILVYSTYRSDIASFERLLARALPDIAIHGAGSPAEAAPYLDETAILYGWGFPPEMPISTDWKETIPLTLLILWVFKTNR